MGLGPRHTAPDIYPKTYVSIDYYYCETAVKHYCNYWSTVRWRTLNGIPNLRSRNDQLGVAFNLDVVYKSSGVQRQFFDLPPSSCLQLAGANKRRRQREIRPRAANPCLVWYLVPDPGQHNFKLTRRRVQGSLNPPIYPETGQRQSKLYQGRLLPPWVG